MTYRISKTFSFSAAHHLPQLVEGHKCRRVHGHNYTVTVVLEDTELDEHGFVQDYGELADVKAFLDEHLDHRDLNEVITEAPTAEILAEALYRQFRPAHPQLCEVVVRETPASTASFRRP